MDILIQGIKVWYPGLFLLGLCAGFLSGFFGVGGGFVLTPLLNIVFSIPYNIAVGSSLGQITGTSFSASVSHGRSGSIDVKLGSFIALSSILGVEIGARMVQALKTLGPVRLFSAEIPAADLFLSLCFMALLLIMGSNIFSESRKACETTGETEAKTGKFARKIRNLSLKPMVVFSASGIGKISLWPVVCVGFALGILSGMLGIGGGIISTPAMIYLFCVPTKIAIGTGLFSIIFTAGYGCLTHAFKGNVDFALVALTLAGGIIGAQAGAFALKKVRAPRIRLWFSVLLFAVAGLVLVKLLTKI